MVNKDTLGMRAVGSRRPLQPHTHTPTLSTEEGCGGRDLEPFPSSGGSTPLIDPKSYLAHLPHYTDSWGSFLFALPQEVLYTAIVVIILYLLGPPGLASSPTSLPLHLLLED